MRPSSPAESEPDIHRKENDDRAVVPDGPTAANVSGPHPTNQSGRVGDGRARRDARRVAPPPG
jgi:hypothetical protein